MKRSLADVVQITQRFARSANVERDDSRQAIRGYLPTARAIDVINRVVTGIEDPAAGRAISVTGPYGSGKSSLALFLLALLGQASAGRGFADELLASCDPSLSDRLKAARAPADDHGFVVAAVVAQREPVTETLLRALRVGVIRFSRGEAQARQVPQFAAVLSTTGPLSALQVRVLLEGVADVAPLVIVLDEFGKNLEQFIATGGAEDDLFVLQEIAEWAMAAKRFPIVLLTLQHLAFEDYAAGAPAAKRREWSKVQGRFIDVPYVESPRQAQALIASVFKTSLDLTSWVSEMEEVTEASGSPDLLHIPMERIYPLHPVTAAVLPELCTRYGQNERTLFSFLAGTDPGAVPSFLIEHFYHPRAPIVCVRLDRVYDFFLQSASTMVSAAASASRWLEIETRIRDTAGLRPAELRVVKSVAVLNLVAAGGVLRASKAMVTTAAADGQPGTSNAAEIETCLTKLEARGIVTYRGFADEYRIWRGSDFDLKGAVELARRRLEDEPPAAILERVRPQAPVVAARHSQQTGTLRAFERHFVDAAGPIPTLDSGQRYDGAVLLCVDPDGKHPKLDGFLGSRPILTGESPSVASIVQAGRELAAHLDVLEGKDCSNSDWVARQELRERAAASAAALDTAIERSFGVWAPRLRWSFNGERRGRGKPRKPGPLSAELSSLCDRYYPDAPIIRNEMLSRRDLTSQGARARGVLLEAMVTNPDLPRCGIEGYGPERAMYEAVLAKPGIHRRRDGVLCFGMPVDEVKLGNNLKFGPTWAAIEEAMFAATEHRVSLEDLYQRLMAPPIGLKEGPIPVLVTAALLAHADTIALYENGTFLARLDPPALERLVRNPAVFAFKYYSIRGLRKTVVGRIADTLGVLPRPTKGNRVGTIVSVVGPLLGRAKSLPGYTQRTMSLSKAAIAVRAALFSATEPDVLLFTLLPEALDAAPFLPDGRLDEVHVGTFIANLNSAIEELNGAFAHLLESLEHQIRECLSVRGGDTRLNIAGRVSQFADVILNSEVKAYVHALADTHLDHKEWLEYLGMVVAGKAPESWLDEDVLRFTLRLHELSTAVRRIEGLHYESAQAQRDGFEAVRVGFTTSDGTDLSSVVWVDNEMKADLERLTTEAIGTAERLLGQAGREMLLAALAMKVLGISGKKESTGAKGANSRKVGNDA